MNDLIRRADVVSLENGDDLKRIRKSKGYTQKQLADKTGLSNLRISQYETGYRELSRVPTIKKFASALGYKYIVIKID